MCKKIIWNLSIDLSILEIMFNYIYTVQYFVFSHIKPFIFFKFRIRIIHQPCTCPLTTQARFTDTIYEAEPSFTKAKKREKASFKNLYFPKEFSLLVALIRYYLAREDLMDFGRRQGSINLSDYLASTMRVVLVPLGPHGRRWNCFWKRTITSYPVGWLLEASGAILEVIVILWLNLVSTFANLLTDQLVFPWNSQTSDANDN